MFLTATNTVRKYLIFIVIGVSLFITSRIQAQQTSSISLNVSPTVVEIDSNPGEIHEGSFKIVNGSDIEVNLSTTPKNFTASDETGGVNITEEDTAYSLAKWISVSPAKIIVPARGSQIFNYKISVPDDAEPGGHFGSIIANTEATQLDLTGPAVSQEVGPLILVKIAGDTFQEASVVSFSAVDSMLQKGPVTFETRVKNTGNVHFKPKGTIEIKNMFGKVVTNINLEEKNVLPDTIRKLTNDWSPSGFNIGKYTANLTLIYGVDNKIVTSSTIFVLFPYKIVLPILLILILIGVLIIKSRKRIAKAFAVLKNG